MTVGENFFAPEKGQNQLLIDNFSEPRHYYNIDSTVILFPLSVGVCWKHNKIFCPTVDNCFIISW
jgi:hypothetical protein